MRNFSLYNQDGRITKVVGRSDKSWTPSSDYLVGSYDSNTVFVVNGEPTNRPTMELLIPKTTGVADGLDEISISGIPEGTEVMVNSGFTSLLHETVTDGMIELSSEYPVTMKVSLKLFPYVTEHISVTFMEDTAPVEDLLGGIL